MVTNKDIQKELQDFRDEMVADMNDLKGFSHSMVDLVSELNKNMQIVMDKTTALLDHLILNK